VQNKPLQQTLPGGVQSPPLWMHGVVHTPLEQVEPEQHGLVGPQGCPGGWHGGAHFPALHTFGAQHWLFLEQVPVAGVQQTELVWSHVRLGRQSSPSSQYAPLLRIAFAVVQIPLLQ
jgi:hypothetical protein